ncbi:ADP-ribose glycohydrolase MACROD1 isoform X4 [Chelonoidis abingdonii]|uniref:ADP-ribose glycohydrolase MACROD1 isoform X4 n=1 Tax=Chelonoidis abingdonii TaxID=106734 RepID=UPI0013F191A4|nr:ADP-ribose glycohydrolase MACROD1 isoform X4 [Chelonoidis abingdonii]
MPGILMTLLGRRLSGALGQLLGGWGKGRIPWVLGSVRRGTWSCREPSISSLPRGTVQLVSRAFRSWAAAPPLGMAAKVDLTTSTDWKEAKTYLKGLNQKQRREHYYTKDFITLKDIDTWKKMAKSARLKQPEETKFPKDNHLNEKISLVRQDITKLEVDAIVNAANSSLLGGGGDVIHAVGPIAQGEPSAAQEKELENCYKNSLKLAVENKLRTVAFPCLSTGVFGYPSDAAAEVVLRTLREWLEVNKEKVDRLVICVFQEKDEEIYKEKLPFYFPIDPTEQLAAQP